MSETVLVIDDDPNIRLVTATMLSRGGYAVICARGGFEGVALFEQHCPDFVVTDLYMPDCEGIETIRAIRRCGHHAAIVVMSGSAAAGADLVRMAQILGADCSLAKPFSASELLQAVARARAARLANS